MVSHAERQQLDFASAAEWENWLGEHHASSDGVRLRVRKSRPAVEGPLVVDTLDVALCFGWIDGTRRGLDENWFLQDYGPRRPRSMWSQVNRDHTERLISAGRMRPAGLVEIDRAKADGRWDAAYRQKDAVVPDDLAAALAENSEAAAMFDRLNSQNRFAVLFRIDGVKRAETRAAKIAGFVEMLSRGETIYPQK